MNVFGNFLAQQDALPQLTARQREILPLILSGMHNGDWLMKLETLQGAIQSATRNVLDESDAAAQLRHFGVVDRNLIRSATKKVLNMIQNEAALMDAPGAKQRLDAK